MSTKSRHVIHKREAGQGEQEWRSGESACLPPVWPGFDSRTRRHMWVEFVVGSLLAPRDFSPGTPAFPSPKKKQHFQIPIRSRMVDEEPLMFYY